MIELKYELKLEELMETLWCMDNYKNGKKRQIHMEILSVLGVGCLIRIYWIPEDMVTYFLCIFIMLALFGLLYGPKQLYRRKGQNILKRGASCNVVFPIVDIDCIFQSDNVITIKRKQDFYCVPKRVLSEDVEIYLEEQIYKQVKKVIMVKP